jgi:hypothetical protein
VNLAELLDQVLGELEKSTEPEQRALLQRLRAGTHTPKDTSDVADMIESFIASRVKPGRDN